jgi:hypothetical protein
MDPRARESAMLGWLESLGQSWVSAGVGLRNVRRSSEVHGLAARRMGR